MPPYTIAVVVNWNDREATLACLDSLAHCTPFRPGVILVDNGSTDGSLEAVCAAWPDVDILALSTNLHFAAGANAGLRRALAHGADYVWLLNNDVTVAPDALAEAVGVATMDTRFGIVRARLVHTGRPVRVVVGAMCDLGSGAIHEPTPPSDPAVPFMAVDYVWGCAMLVQAKMLRQVGLLDEGYVAYFEDADLCLRAKRSGWHTVTALRATVHHAGSKTANRRFVQQMWLRGRNWLRCYWRHAPDDERPRLLMTMLIRRLPHLAWSTVATIAARALRPRECPIHIRS